MIYNSATIDYHRAHSPSFGEDNADDSSPRSNYSRGRSFRTTRRPKKRRGSTPTCGISARRNKRVTW